MKTIPKEHLDELIRLTKKYYRTSDVDILPATYKAADQLSISVRGNTLSALCFSNVVSAMFGGFGLKRDATYQDVYDVFALLGYEVISDSEGDEDESA